MLVGATTENPSFELNGALLSRCQVFVLKRLDDTALSALVTRAERCSAGGCRLMTMRATRLSRWLTGMVGTC